MVMGSDAVYVLAAPGGVPAGSALSVMACSECRHDECSSQCLSRSLCLQSARGPRPRIGVRWPTEYWRSTDERRCGSSP